MKKNPNKINILDRIFFISLIFIVPFMVEITSKFGILLTAIMGACYVAVGAIAIRKLSSYCDPGD